MSNFITKFGTGDEFKCCNDCLKLIKPGILEDKLDRKMQIETHTFYIHILNTTNGKSIVLMVQILVSNVLDGLQKSIEVLFSIMNDYNEKENDCNVFLKQKVKKPFEIGDKFIKGKNLNYTIGDDNINLSYKNNILEIDLTFNRGESKSVKILPNGEDQSVSLKNGEIEHIYTLGLSINNSHIKYKNKDMLIHDDIIKFNTSFIIAMQNGLPYKIVDFWKFFNNTNRLIMEYGFENEILSTCVFLDAEGNIKIKHCIVAKSLIEQSVDNLVHVRRYEILKELPKVVLMLMKRLTSSNPVLNQYVSGDGSSLLYETTDMGSALPRV